MPEAKYNIKQARLMRGLSMRDAAKLIGISHNAIHKMETGQMPISDERVKSFMKAYNVTMDYLIGKPVEITFGEIRYFKINHSYEKWIN